MNESKRIYKLLSTLFLWLAYYTMLDFKKIILAATDFGCGISFLILKHQYDSEKFIEDVEFRLASSSDSFGFFQINESGYSEEELVKLAGELYFHAFEIQEKFKNNQSEDFEKGFVKMRQEIINKLCSITVRKFIARRVGWLFISLLNALIVLILL